MKIKSQPYQLLIPIFVFILLLSLLKSPQATFDIHLHDTYFVIAVRFILLIFAVFTIVVWGIYSLTNKLLLSSIFTWIHIAITIITVVTLVSVIFWSGIVPGPALPRRYVDWSEFDAFATINRLVAITAIVLLFSPLLYIINLVLGLLLKKPTNPNRH